MHLQQDSYGDKPFVIALGIALGIPQLHAPFLSPDRSFGHHSPAQISLHRDHANLGETIPRDAISGRYREFGFESGAENAPRRREFMQAFQACVSFIGAQLGIAIHKP